MDEDQAVGSVQEVAQPAGPYTVYAAGGLFTHHELAMNVLVKEAVWRLSGGRFQLLLPQSRELRALDGPDVGAYIRNGDLLEVVRADAVIARFDGLELDSGTVVEYIAAKSLGKPTVILRCDYRRMSCTGLDEPYNLMVKSWPRTLEVHTDCLVTYGSLFGQERQGLGDGATFEATMQAELGAVQRSVDEMAQLLVDGLGAAIQMDSPYPPEYQELVYRAFRYAPGSGFDQVLTEGELEEIIRRLRRNGTL